MIDTQSLAQAVGAALQAGDRPAFVAAARALIAARPAMNSGYKGLVDPLVDSGELTLARAAIDAFVAANDGSPAARLDQAMTYVRTSRPKEALAILDTVPAGSVDANARDFLEGTLCLNLGLFDRAQTALRRVLQRLPQSGQVYLSLAQAGRMDRHPALAELIRSAAGTMASAPATEQGSYYYALGKLHADEGAHADAFAAFERGARIIAQSRPHDRDFDRRQAGNARSGWTPEVLARADQAIRIATDAPILVTGLPRSGSTLVEQILAAHSEVNDGEELGRFNLVAERAGGVDASVLDDPAAAERLARYYLHLFRDRFGNTGRAVDKSLEASRYLGLAAAILPEAPILWMRRDPLDNAWSAFRTFFLRGVDWSWSLADIADHMMIEDELLAAWQDLLGDRLMVVDYAELVRDKDRMIPRILAHAGLEMEAAALEPEKVERVVTTNSLAQVRQPINTGGLGVAEPYREWLGPFLDRYRPRG